MQAFCRCISLAHFWHLSEVNVQVDCRKGFFLVSHPSLDYLQNAQTSGPAFFCYPENISFNVMLRGATYCVILKDKTLLRHPDANGGRIQGVLYCKTRNDWILPLRVRMTKMWNIQKSDNYSK